MSRADERYSALLQFWGKTDREDPTRYHPAFYHCLDVAAVGEALFDQRPGLFEVVAHHSGATDIEALRRWLLFLLGAHDIGKLADGFQGLAPDLLQRLQDRTATAPYNDWRHDLAGFALLRHQILTDPRQSAWLPQSFGAAQSALRLASPWLQAICGHHGQPIKVEEQHNSRIRQDEQFPSEAHRAAATWISILADLYGTDDPFEGLVSGPAAQHAFQLSSWWTAGWAVLSDWLGSSSSTFPFEENPVPPHDYLDRSRERARQAIRESDLVPHEPRTVSSYSDLLGKDFAPTDLQTTTAELQISETPQLVVVEESTGGGKTEAALMLASRLLTERHGNGLYFALPTQATANAIFDRVLSMYRRLYEEQPSNLEELRNEPALALAHGQACLWLEELRLGSGYGNTHDDVQEISPSWLHDNSKKALLAQVGVGTIDQALIGVLPLRHQSLRILGLTGKVLIVDEVHAADAYVSRLLRSLLAFHAASGGSAILLSATLPLSQRGEFARSFAAGASLPLDDDEPVLDDSCYPALLHVGEHGAEVHALQTRGEVARTIRVQWHTEQSHVFQRLVGAAREGRCACWIRNTVIDAMEAYHILRGELGRDVALFHSRFTVEDRAAIEGDAISRFGPDSGPAERRGRVLVATQVVEQSLDLDFDVLVSDLAPVDLLIQRVGRHQRHRRDADGCRVGGPDERGGAVLDIYGPEPVPSPPVDWYSSVLPRASYVYPDHGRLWLTASALRERGSFTVPDDLRELVESVYGEFDEERECELGELVEASILAQGNERAAESVALRNALSIHDGYGGATDHWSSEVHTPTRLGDPTNIVRLCRERDGVWGPWSTAARHAWQRSEIRVRAHQIAAEGDVDTPAIEDVKAKMPDGGKWSTVLLLREAGDHYTATALDGRGERQEWHYCPDLGLRRAPRE